MLRETFTITYAHSLPTFPEGHKCRAVHGHTATITVDVFAPIDGMRGYALDHAEIGRVLTPSLRALDHKYINDVPGLDDGLAETLLAWLVDRFSRQLKQLGAGVELRGVELNEMSSGGTFQLVTHTKIWRA